MSRRSERGSSMMLALLTLFFVASMAAVVLARQDGLRSATILDGTEMRARYAAEGGLVRARWELERDSTWVGGSIELNGIQVQLTVEGDRIVAVASPGSVRITVLRAP
jgi:hypothetical protein